MGIRRKRLDMRIDDQAVSRTVNGHLKTKERARRQARMVELLKKGTFPYTSAVRSFLSVELGTPASRLTAEDVKSYLAGV
jgi:hypothetical protein